MSFWNAAQKASDALGNSQTVTNLGNANTVWSTKSHYDAGDKLGLGSDAIGIVQMFLTKAYATPIISAGLLAIQGMTMTCGVGDPDSGDRFGRGAEQLDDVHQTLETAAPTDSWQGDASRAYMTQDSKQQERTRAIAEADKKLEAVISKQAEQVNQTRNFLGAYATVLGYAILPAMAAKAFPATAPFAIAIEVGAVAGAVPPSAVKVSMMSANAAANAAEIGEATARYAKVAASATFGK